MGVRWRRVRAVRWKEERRNGLSLSDVNEASVRWAWVGGGSVYCKGVIREGVVLAREAVHKSVLLGC